VISVYGDTVAALWAARAGVVYDPLAAALVATCPVRLTGARVLDAGSGAGVTASLVAADGGEVVACDLSSSMIGAQIDRCWPAAVADVLALPFPAEAFDAAVAAFLLNHLDPETALRELARVVRPRGAVIASTWAAGPDPVKSAIDGILTARGWTPPAWYRTMKTVVEAVSGDPDRLGTAARRAGLVDVSVARRAESLGVDDPLAVIHYRLATPHIFPWVASLDGSTKRRLIDDAASAVEPLLAQWRPAVLFLAGRIAGR
jgi:SAM-dependent methyltransferase